MVVDRTIEDVVSAKKIIEEKLKNFLEISAEDLEVLERGTITINTINRIEQAQSDLFEYFISAGYFPQKIINKVWNENEIFNSTDFERLIANGEVLRKAFYDYENTPDEALPKYAFEQLNAIERLLYDLRENYEYMVSNWKRCGIYRCGGVING